MQVINVLKLRGKLGAILNRVADGEHYVVERFNKPLVVVVPFEEYRKKMLKLEEDELKRRQIAVTGLLKLRQNNIRKLSSGKDSTLIIRNFRDEKNT